MVQLYIKVFTSGVLFLLLIKHQTLDGVSKSNQQLNYHEVTKIKIKHPISDAVSQHLQIQHLQNHF